MTTPYINGMPLIPSGKNPYVVEPINMIEFPCLPLESRNKFRKILTENLYTPKKATFKEILDKIK